MRRQRQPAGYTLLELMIAVAIAGILLVIGVPSYRLLAANNRATSQANSFISLITYARTEAIRRNRTVGLCKSIDGTTCSTASAGWESGVLVFTFTDTNSNGTWDSGESINIVRADVPFARKSTITGNHASINNSFVFQPNGRGSGTGSFLISPTGSSTNQQRSVVMTFGRPRIQCPQSTNLQC